MISLISVGFAISSESIPRIFDKTHGVRVFDGAQVALSECIPVLTRTRALVDRMMLLQDPLFIENLAILKAKEGSASEMEAIEAFAAKHVEELHPILRNVLVALLPGSDPRNRHPNQRAVFKDVAQRFWRLLANYLVCVPQRIGHFFDVEFSKSGQMHRLKGAKLLGQSFDSAGNFNCQFEIKRENESDQVLFTIPIRDIESGRKLAESPDPAYWVAEERRRSALIETCQALVGQWVQFTEYRKLAVSHRLDTIPRKNQLFYGRVVPPGDPCQVAVIDIHSGEITNTVLSLAKIKTLVSVDSNSLAFYGASLIKLKQLGLTEGFHIGSLESAGQPEVMTPLDKAVLRRSVGSDEQRAAVEKAIAASEAAEDAVMSERRWCIPENFGKILEFAMLRRGRLSGQLTGEICDHGIPFGIFCSFETVQGGLFHIRSGYLSPQIPPVAVLSAEEAEIWENEFERRAELERMCHSHPGETLKATTAEHRPNVTRYVTFDAEVLPEWEQPKARGEQRTAEGCLVLRDGKVVLLSYRDMISLSPK